MGIYHKNALPAGHRLAEYEIQSVLGHGGFGITYLAKDTSLGALVAVKEYLPNELAARDGETAVVPILEDRNAVKSYQWGLQRFIEEARALALYKHPNIVRVLRYMEMNGTAYVVMEYEQGMSLARHLKNQGGQLIETDLLRVILPVLNGLTVLHENNMLHLDIKPDNIYIRVDGTPMLIDFGSARSAISQAKHVILTPGYAPIEQYPDKGKQGPWTDLYAIGATMYKCITGKKPEDSLNRYKTILQYQADPLTPVKKLVKGKYQPYLLDCINWSMQLYPKDRPKSARELQDSMIGKHLKRRITGSSNSISKSSNQIAAKKASTRIRIPKQRKHKSGKGKWTFIFIALVIAVGLGAWFWPKLGPKVQALLKKNNISITLPKVSGLSRDKINRENRTTKTRGSQGTSSMRGRGKETAPPVRSVTVSMPDRVLYQLTGHKDWVMGVAVSPDGSMIASAGADNKVRLWSLSRGSLRQTMGAGSRTNTSVAFSPSGNLVAAGSVDGRVRVWKTSNGRKQITLKGHAHDVNAVAFSPNGRWLATGSKDQSIILWSTRNWNASYTLTGHTSEVLAVAFSPNGQLLATAGADKSIKIWDMESFTLLATFTGHRRKILSLAFSPNGKYIVSGGAGDGVRIWSVQRGRVIHRLDELPRAMSVQFSPNGKYVAAAGGGGQIVYWDAYNGRFVQRLSAHDGYVNAIAFSKDGRLVSGGRDKILKVWGH